MTFSVIARCANTGMFGVAITSSSPAVAARCSFARAGTGAVASQNVTDPTLGPKTLDAIDRGLSAADAIDSVIGNTQYSQYRQLLAVDKNGVSAIHSGEHSLGVWSHSHATDVACGGNLLASENIPQAMVDAFVKSKGHLGDRLINTLKTGLLAGGEAGPVYSAGLKIVHTVAWPVADLRVDWCDDCPIDALDSLWARYQPQLNDYVQRALNPTLAPSYGVPGDDG